MKRILAFNLVVCILLSTLSMIALANQRIEIIRGGDFNDADYWLISPKGQARINNASIRDGKAFLMVNETHGYDCFFSGVQQGKYPHGWDQKDSIYELEIRRNLEASPNCLWINIIAKRSKFEYYNETFSVVNLGIMLWLQLDENYDKPTDKSSQLEIDINIASFMYSDGKEKLITWDSHFKGEWPFPDRDYHYIDSSNNLMLEPDRWYEITIDAGQVLAKAFNAFEISNAKLKSFDIYIEAKYGYGEAEIEYVDFVFEPKLNSGYVIFQSLTYGILVFLVLTLIWILLRMGGRLRRQAS
ncbi:hypothetical protein J7L18_04780 [Candidatus Bathyarchaeota archaeon]|nr:hypothetical protein [Candidatus Bathyarchaeota archaeon]